MATLMKIHGFDMIQISRAIDYLESERGRKEQEERRQKMAEERSRKKELKKKRMTPLQFFDMLSLACEEAKRVHGENWHLATSCYRWGRLPKNMASQKGHATTHRWPRDHKIPHAIYWPNKEIPNVGIEF